MIFAATPGSDDTNDKDTNGQSNRPLATITPLATALGITPDVDWAVGTESELARVVTSGFSGQVVLICWHHGKLPALAQDIGVPDPPSPWPPTEFSWLWEIDYSTDPHTLIPHYQMLLYGDATGSNASRLDMIQRTS